jgi:predicted RNA binding protein YcfA (HicA-like mRNA interferase family)
MPEVPSLPGERIVWASERAGFKVARVNGSHHVMRHPMAAARLPGSPGP